MMISFKNEKVNIFFFFVDIFDVTNYIFFCLDQHVHVGFYILISAVLPYLCSLGISCHTWSVLGMMITYIWQEDLWLGD